MPNQTSFKTIMIVLALPILLSSLSTSITNIAVPALIVGFNISFSTAQWIIICYLITMTSVAIVTGSLGDNFDRRTLLLIAIFLFMVASAGCGFTRQIEWLILFRILQGISAAIMINSTMALIACLKEQGSSGSAMGWIGTLSATGTAIGPTLGGVLINQWGWSSIFFINIPLCMIAFILVATLIEKQVPQSQSRKKTDISGVFLLTSIIVAYSLAITLWRSVSVILLIMAAIGTVIFFWIEKNKTNALIPLDLLKQARLVNGISLSMIVATVMMATLIIGPFYLTYKLNLSPLWVGLTLSCGPVVAALAGIPAGKLVDKWGSDNIVSAALFLMTLGLVLFIFYSDSLNQLDYIIFISIITLGYAAFQTANNTSIMYQVESNAKGLLAGILNLSRNLGLINGATLMAAIFSMTSGYTVNTSDQLIQPDKIAYGLKATFSVAALLTGLSLVISLRKKTGH